jgi:hypothetical protein
VRASTFVESFFQVASTMYEGENLNFVIGCDDPVEQTVTVKDKQLTSGRVVLLGYDATTIRKLPQRPGSIARLTNERVRIAL